MKKLMTMIAAVATAFGLYAAGNTWTPSGDALGKTLDVLKADDGSTGEFDRYWSYSDSEGVADGEAEVTAEGQLVLKTGNKILTRNIKGVMSGTETDFEPCDIPDESNEVGLFFDTKTIFGAPCDDFAALADTDKFAAFFLDETELGIEGIADAATNLWVIGSDGTTETAFRMQLTTLNGKPVTIDEGWLDAEKRVVVKAYANGNGSLPGFVVYVADAEYGTFAKVIGKAPISDGKIGTYTAVTASNYLTGTIGVPGRYTDRQLVLGRVEAADGLFGEAFKGTGTITGLTVGDTCPTGLEDLFTETQYMTVEATDVTINVTEGATYDSEAGTFAGKNGTEVKFTVTSKEPATKTLITVDIDGVKYAAEEGVYTIEFDADKTLTVAAVVPVATVNDTAYATFAEVLEAVEDLTSVNLVLNNAAIVEDEAYITIDSSAAWTIDLNGKTLAFCLSGMNACINNAGGLTIIDSATGGKIENTAAEDASALISNESTGTVDIRAGIFDGAVSNSEGMIKAYAGTKFLKGEDDSINAKATIEGYATEAGVNLEVVEDNDYWKVQEKQKTNLSAAVIKLVKDSIIYGEAAPEIDSVKIDETTLTEGDDYTVECTYVAGNDVNTYSIIVKAADDSDYTGQNSAEFTVTAKALTITGMTAANKVYDKTTAATISGGTLEGIVGTDEVSIENPPTAGTFADANVGTDKKVTFDAMTLTGAKAGNYTLTPPELTADITKAAVTVKADNMEINEGAEEPTYTAQVTSGTIYEGDTGVYTLSSTYTKGAPAGDYDITVAQGENTNYEVTGEKGTLTVKSAGPDPVDPTEGGEIPCTPGQEETVAADVTAHPEKYVKAPEGVKAEDVAGYQAMFKGEVAGEGKVKLVLNETATTEIQEAISQDVTEIPVSTITAEAAGVTLTTKPGLYYSVIGGDTVDATGTLVEPAMATDTTMEITIPKAEANSQFYRIKVSVTAE